MAFRYPNPVLPAPRMMAAPDLGDPYADEEVDAFAGGIAPPAIATPAPPIAPKPPSALDRVKELEAQRPMRSDPALKPKPIERVLSTIAGAGLGFGAGYLNSSRRGPVVDPNIGANVAGAIANRRYNRAASEWGDKMGAAQSAAQIEAAQTKAEQDKTYNDARVASENAQRAHAEAVTARMNTPERPRPIEHDPSKALVDPSSGKVLIPAAKPEDTPKTIEARINAIRASGLPKPQQDEQVNVAVQDYNALHPDKPVERLVTDDTGMVRVVVRDPVNGTVTATEVGRYGKTKSEPLNVAGDKAADQKRVEDEANRILQQSGGDYDKAIAAATVLAVKDRLVESRNKANVGKKPGRSITIGGKTISVDPGKVKTEPKTPAAPAPGGAAPKKAVSRAAILSRAQAEGISPEQAIAAAQRLGITVTD